MGYLTSLYSLFPCLGSKEQCNEDMGRRIIREVMFQHLRATELEFFDEVAEELFYFDDVMLRIISCAFEKGLQATDSDSRFTDAHEVVLNGGDVRGDRGHDPPVRHGVTSGLIRREKR